MNERTGFAPGRGYGAEWVVQPVLQAEHLRKDFPLSQLLGEIGRASCRERV